ncbi:MAG: DNA polymerase III subunit delta [Candidatus Zixiibacteriota bacterium]
MGKKLTYPEFLKKLGSSSKEPANALESVYHFTGEEDLLKEEAWRKVVSILVPDDLRSFNLDFLYGRETSADQIINQASTAPVNARKRVVILFELEKLSAFAKDVLLSFLPKLPDSTCLILISPKIASPVPKFYQALGEIATTVDFPKMRGNQVSAWTAAKLREANKKVDQTAIQTLQEMVGDNLADLAREIDKLVTYVGPNQLITSADVEAVAGLSKTNTVFQLMDSVGERDCKTSLHILKKLTSAGENPGGVVFWLTQHLERLILAKESSSQSVGALTSVLKVAPFLATKYQNQVKNFSLDELEKGLILLYETDVQLKSNLMPDDMLLELLVYNLCHQ